MRVLMAGILARRVVVVIARRGAPAIVRAMRLRDLDVLVVGNPPPGFGGRYFLFVKLVDRRRHRRLGRGLCRDGRAGGDAGGDRRRLRAAHGRREPGGRRADVPAGLFGGVQPAAGPDGDRGVLGAGDRLLGHRRQGARAAGACALGRAGARAAALLQLPLSGAGGGRGGVLQRSGGVGGGGGADGRGGVDGAEVRSGGAVYDLRRASADARRPRPDGGVPAAAARGGGRPGGSDRRDARAVHGGRGDPAGAADRGL